MDDDENIEIEVGVAESNETGEKLVAFKFSKRIEIFAMRPDTAVSVLQNLADTIRRCNAEITLVKGSAHRLQ